MQHNTSLSKLNQGLTPSSGETWWERVVEVHSDEKQFQLAQIKEQAYLPSVATLRKKDPVRLFGEYVRLFKQLATFYNDEKLMGAEFVKEVTITIQETYPYFTLADLQYIIRKGKANAWSKVYGSVNGGTIMEWCANYDQERTNYIESQRGQISNTHKAQVPTHDGLTDLGKNIKQLTQKP